MILIRSFSLNKIHNFRFSNRKIKAQFLYRLKISVTLFNIFFLETDGKLIFHFLLHGFNNIVTMNRKKCDFKCYFPHIDFSLHLNYCCEYSHRIIVLVLIFLLNASFSFNVFYATVLRIICLLKI